MRLRVLVSLLVIVGFVFVSLIAASLQSEPVKVETVNQCPEDAIVVKTWVADGHDQTNCLTFDDFSETTQREIAERTGNPNYLRMTREEG